MAKFKDCTGREWDLTIPNFGVVAKLRTETALDLNRIGHDTAALVEVLLGDADQLLAAVWSLLKTQTPAITFEQFLDAVDAAALDAIRMATIDATLDFFHHGRAAAMKSRLRENMIPILSGSKSSDGNSPASAG